jgi:hypothetical protein
MALYLIFGRVLCIIAGAYLFSLILNTDTWLILTPCMPMQISRRHGFLDTSSRLVEDASTREHEIFRHSGTIQW